MRLGRLALALTVAGAVVGGALAQRQPGGGRGGFGMGAMFKNEALQKELKLEKDQVEKITEALTKVQEELKDERPQQGASQEERQAFQKKSTEASQKALAKVLNADQAKRLKEIQFQQRLNSPFGGGPAVFADAEIQTALKLTDDQKEKIKDIVSDYTKERQEMFQGLKPGGGGDFQEAQKKMQGLTKEAMANVNKLLKDDQKKMIEEMKGKEFDVASLTTFGGGKPGGKPGKPGDQKKKVDF